MIRPPLTVRVLQRLAGAADLLAVLALGLVTVVAFGARPFPTRPAILAVTGLVAAGQILWAGAVLADPQRRPSSWPVRILDTAGAVAWVGLMGSLAGLLLTATTAGRVEPAGGLFAAALVLAVVGKTAAVTFADRLRHRPPTLPEALTTTAGVTL